MVTGGRCGSQPARKPCTLTSSQKVGSRAVVYCSVLARAALESAGVCRHKRVGGGCKMRSKATDSPTSLFAACSALNTFRVFLARVFLPLYVPPINSAKQVNRRSLVLSRTTPGAGGFALFRLLARRACATDCISDGLYITCWIQRLGGEGGRHSSGSGRGGHAAGVPIDAG